MILCKTRGNKTIWFDLKAHAEHDYDLAYKNLIFETQLKAQMDPSEHDHDDPEDHDNSESDLHMILCTVYLRNQIPFLTDASLRMRQLSSQQADRSWLL